MDSSSKEPREFPIIDTTGVARILKPHLVVAPDSDMDTNKTVRESLAFIEDYGKSLRKLGIGILGMVQGASLKQCLYCYRSLVRKVDAIGLPRSTEASVGRKVLLSNLTTKKPIYLFGVHSNPEKELDLLSRFNIEGIVSSLPVRLGLGCRLLEEWRPEPPPLDFNSNYNPFPEFTRRIIEDFIDLAGG